MSVDMSSFIIANLVCLYFDMYNLASYMKIHTANMRGRRARGSELYGGGGGFDLWGLKQTERRGENKRRWRGSEARKKGKKCFFGLLCIPPPLSLSRPHAATHGHPPICT
jgi:hypothetical protein